MVKKRKKERKDFIRVRNYGPIRASYLKAYTFIDLKCLGIVVPAPDHTPYMGGTGTAATLGR